MTEIQFTKRTATIFQRSIETHIDEWEKNIREIQKDEDADRINNPIIIAAHDGWDLSMMYDANDIGNDNEEYVWESIRALILIDGSDGTREHIYNWTPIFDYKPEQIDALVKTYHICVDCDRYCWKDSSFCRKCYPFVTEHTEDCCCCLDRSLGVWYKLICGHILHQRCYNKIEKEHGVARCERKCPLCRTLCEHDDCKKL
jgi:hypothetical protein